jgi:hypothetical protein
VASSAGSAAKKMKQMVIDDALRLHIANILHADMQDSESKYSKALEPPRTHGRPEAMKNLADFLNDSQHLSCIGKNTTPKTVTEWIDKLKEAGKAENERQINVSNAGRNSEHEVLHLYVSAWADLAQLFSDSKKEVHKTTRTPLFLIT